MVEVCENSEEAVGIGCYFCDSVGFRPLAGFDSSKAEPLHGKRMVIVEPGKPAYAALVEGSLAVWLAGKLRLNEYRKEQLAADLRAAGIQLSPEMHTANAIVRSALVAAAAIPVYFLVPWLSAVVLALAVLLYLKASREIADAIREKKKQIEYDLPQFVAHVDHTLKHNRDVLAIIDGYREYAGRAFREELEITAADMRSGSYEAALTRLEARVGSSMLSDVVRCLIGVLHGDNTEMAINLARAVAKR